MYDSVRYFPLTNEQREILLSLLTALRTLVGADDERISHIQQVLKDLAATGDADWIEAAKEVWEGNNFDHDVEIQDNAVVSESESGGAWVQGWLWVANEQNPALPGIPNDEDEDA